MSRADKLLVLGATALLLSAPSPAQRVDIETHRKNETIIVEVSAEMPVDPRTVWSVITDYDHLPRFIPYMRSSRVLQRDADRVIVEQSGELVFLFFRQPVEVKLSVVESPQTRVAARAIGGNLKALDGRYTVESLPSGYTRLSYSGRLVPDFDVPPVIGRIALQTVMARQFDAMVKEIVRRDAERIAPAR
ncbi:SRPBCC family protein [Variovorax sp. YR216]|uniref:SRPBCC family protein n=1 Tax=Variovorax sp. YR216 TaxID=1882828 RepID=UPI0008995F8A|nr:SRPBCC family protein [Variovorax sp. YR216]SEB16331.1 Ribosome association toxin PasT (RatA) of the RatAB toxin-antitoxin module [Variovorax sp. YR216]